MVNCVLQKVDGHWLCTTFGNGMFQCMTTCAAVLRPA
jgi:hypothetical protein